MGGRKLGGNGWGVVAVVGVGRGLRFGVSGTKDGWGGGGGGGGGAKGGLGRE